MGKKNKDKMKGDLESIEEERVDDNFEQITKKKAKKKKKKFDQQVSQMKNCVEVQEIESSDSNVPTLDSCEDQAVDDNDDDDGPVEDLPSVRVKNDLTNKKQSFDSLVSNETLHLLVPKLMRLDTNDLQLLKQKNVIVQRGRFTHIENAIIQRNWKRYLEDYNIPNPALLLGHFQYERGNDRLNKIKKEYQRFSQETQLWLRLAKDLPHRTIYQIYCRARYLLSDLKMAKDFDENDRQIILELYKKHGDNYTRFCEKRGYNPKCAREIVRNSIKANGTKLNRGEWTHDEMVKLRKVVDELAKQLKLKSYEGIPWSQVAQKLKRSDIQCRQKFFTKTIFTMAANSLDGWNDKFEFAKFIALLKHLNFPHQSVIDWDFIKEKFSINFFHILLRRWQELRVRVPDYQNLELPDIIDYLYKKRVIKPFGDDPEKMKEIEHFAKT